AVNMVDFIDEDAYRTPFHGGLIGSPAFVKSVETSTQQWVFGVELPHVLINEAYAQYSIEPNDKPLQKGQNHTTNVEVWVELYNPLSDDPTLPENGKVRLDSGVGATRGYRLLLAKPLVQGFQIDTYLRN